MNIFNLLPTIADRIRDETSPLTIHTTPKQRPTENYCLPDGRIVAIFRDVSRGAPMIDFTLPDGQIVFAIRYR